MSMTNWNYLPPDEQRQELASQMRILRDIDWIVRSRTVEALAISRELLTVPIYRSPKLEETALYDER
jgi:hypothetical protein